MRAADCKNCRKRLKAFFDNCTIRGYLPRILPIYCVGLTPHTFLNALLK